MVLAESEAIDMGDMDTRLETTRPIDALAAQQLLDTLQAVSVLEDRLRLSKIETHHSRSLLATDVTPDGGNPGFEPASIAIVSALDHLQTWAYLVGSDLVRFPLPILSHFTLARAAYESSLHVLWLLDPTVSSRDRIGRGYAIQLQSLEDMHTYQQSAGMSGPAANASTLHAKLLAAAQRDGYVQITRRRGRSRITPPLTHPVPSMSQLFDDYDRPPSEGGGQARFRYNMMSGLAHSRHWAIAGTTADLSAATADGYRIAINFPLVCGVAESTVAAASRAVDAFIGYRTASGPSLGEDLHAGPETAAECELCSSGLPAVYGARTPDGDIQICERCATTTAANEGWTVSRL